MIACVSPVYGWSFVTDGGLKETAESANIDLGVSGEGQNIFIIIRFVIYVILSFVGVIFLILLIIGGYLWMTSLGNEQQLSRAKNIVRNSIIGLILVISAYAITRAINSLLN